MREHKPYENEINRILSLLNEGRYAFGFPKTLEQRYGQYLKKRILQRVPAVGISSVLFILIFCVLDIFFLPHDIATLTVSVRLLLTIPLITIACLWLYFKPPSFYLWIYSAVFLLVGLSVVWIIWFTHNQGVWLPYEGLMIIMTYGFVVMGLPLVLASTLNGIMVMAYAVSEPLYDVNFPVYVNNLTFLLAMYGAGIVSAWILTYAQRGQFLHQHMLKLNQKQAQAEIDSRNRYLAAASHDLRQPMQAIDMMVDSLAKDTADTRIHKLKTASKSLSSMFTQLLDMSRINLNLVEITPQTIHLSSFIDSILVPFKVKAEKQGIELTVDVDNEYYVSSDPAALQRIISNLLQNALTHSGATNIHIQCRTWQEDTVLVIKDNGCGIPEEEHNNIFSAFSRLPNQQGGGLGLGLAIVKELTSRLNHDLKLINDNGAKFILSLPRTSATQKPATHNDILIVEDDGGVLSQYQQWFIRWGWDVHVAYSLEQAMSYLPLKPTWILSDMYLSDGTAQQLFQTVESMEDYQPKGILVSGSHHTDVEDTAQLYKLVRLHKPVSPSRLRSVLLD
ncbi:ATP-binding protein [Bermanella sp. R86510]|uniref:ATP-binding response regulator n=1 Tax=unclassified Bermanella TaxID=2627862 RepID=UPI0037CA0A9F